MTRRARSDSTEAMIEAMAGAGKEIKPPANVPLEDSDLPFFRSVIAEFARASWTQHQLELAAMLARTMADLEREQRELRLEGTVFKSERGTPVINPRKTAIQMHYSNIHSARRSLALHARAQGGEARDVAKRKGMALAAENDAGAGDDLIARPN